MKNVQLKLAMLEADMTQRELARRVGLNESIISLVCNGRYVLRDEEQERVAKELRRPKENLFRGVRA